MILDDKTVIERLESPLNLINRLRGSASVNLKTGDSFLPSRDKSRSQPVSLPPSIDDLVSDVDDRLRDTSIETTARTILLSSMTRLSERLEEVDKPETLARITENMTRVVNSINEAKIQKNNGNQVTINIYAPQLMTESEYDIVDVSAVER